MAYAPTAVAGDLPILTTCAANEPRFNNARRIGQNNWSAILNDGSAIPLPITLLAEEARTNLLVTPATPATQNITTTAQPYTVSMWGTGTCVLTGTATGTLTGTGATDRVSLTVPATAGTLTLTFSGTNTNGQFEAGPTMSSYIPNNTPRVADVASLTGVGLSWYNAEQGTFVIKASGKYSSAPGNIGVWNPLLTGEGTYAIRYNKNIDNSAYLYLPNAQAGVNPVEYQYIPTPTTILLCEQGIINISSWTYYPSDLTPSVCAGLVNGTLTTIFDTSYAATSNFTSAFQTYPWFSAKYFPKINTSNATNLSLAWYQLPVPTFPSIDTTKVTNFTSAFRVLINLVIFPLLNTIAATNFNLSWDGDTSLTTFPPNFFDNAKATVYTNSFRNCALSQTSVDNILVSINQSRLNTPSLINGTLNMTGGTNATPSATGLAAKAALVAAGWAVSHN
jgi:hypothetical protein